MTIGVYIRVSTANQKTDSQKAEIKKWLEAHNHDLDDVQWFEDKETGAHTQRESLKRLNAEIFKGTIKTVVIWKLDRVARSLQDGINTICDWCEKGVRIVSVTQQIDLSGSVGRMIATVLFGIAEIELTNIKERQAAGIREARQKGKFKGRKAGTQKASPEDARRLKKQGLSNKEIMGALGIKSRTTLYNYLSK